METKTAAEAKRVWAVIAREHNKEPISPATDHIFVSSEVILTRERKKFLNDAGEMEEMDFGVRYGINPEIESEHPDGMTLVQDLVFYGNETLRVGFLTWRQAARVLLADEPVLWTKIEGRIL